MYSLLFRASSVMFAPFILEYLVLNLVIWPPESCEIMIDTCSRHEAIRYMIIIISVTAIVLYLQMYVFSPLGFVGPSNKIGQGAELDVDVEENLSVEELLSDFVVVTAISSSHYNESLDMLGSVHHFLPDTLIIIYDLGLDKKQEQELKELKNVQIRRYDFDAPEHTNYFKMGFYRGLGCYAWKIFIIDEISKEYQVFIWLDASIRLLKPITTNDCIQSVNDIHVPLTACFNHFRKMVEFTNNGTFEYLNISRQQMKDVRGFESNCMMFKMTKKMQLIIKKWVDCAHNAKCICGTDKPTFERVDNCNFSMPQGTKFINCHRYSQATLTWLLALYIGMDKVDKVVKSSCNGVFKIARHATLDWRKYIVKKI